MEILDSLMIGLVTHRNISNVDERIELKSLELLFLYGGSYDNGNIWSLVGVGMSVSNCPNLGYRV